MAFFWLSLHGAFSPVPATTIISGAASGRPPQVISFFAFGAAAALPDDLPADLATGLAAAGAAFEEFSPEPGDLNLERAFKAVPLEMQLVIRIGIIKIGIIITALVMVLPHECSLL